MPDDADPGALDPAPPGPPRVWALLGHRAGDNNQVLALAEALGLPFAEKRLRANLLRLWPTAWTRPGLGRLDRASRDALAPPPGGAWPELVILAGQRFVPAARWLRAQSSGPPGSAASGNGTRIVAIGRPRCPPGWLDLVLTTPNYGVPAAPNVLGLPVPLTRLTPARLAEAVRNPAEPFRHPAPRLALLLGGDSPPFRLRPADALAGLRALAARAAARGGSVLAIGSRRTPPAVLEAVRAAVPSLGVPAALLEGTGEASPYAALLASADEVAVTADSAAMIADALATGRPVWLVPVRAGRIGGAWLRAVRRLRRAAEGEAVGVPAPLAGAARWLARRGPLGWPRDPWFLWCGLERGGLTGWLGAGPAGARGARGPAGGAGSGSRPGAAPDVRAAAVARVRALPAGPYPSRR